MNLRKVSVGDRDVQKKYRVQTNCSVSYWNEEFDCGAQVSMLAYGRKKPKPNYGISKLEHKVSTGWFVNALKGEVQGG